MIKISNPRSQQLLRYDILAGVIVFVMIALSLLFVWNQNQRPETEKRALALCDMYETIIVCDNIIGVAQEAETYTYINTNEEQFECPSLAHENMRAECRQLFEMTKARIACKEVCKPLFFLK